MTKPVAPAAGSQPAPKGLERAGIGPVLKARPPLADPIETMRGMVVLLLLSFHVIGANQGAGLQLDYPHPLRIFADLLIDLRMPLFAFIAGYVYGLRPVRVGAYRDFAVGKFKRLAVPGGIAALIFALIANAGGSDKFAVPADSLWKIFVFPYAHFWFLQAILLIFLVQGLVEIVIGHRPTAFLLGTACALLLLLPYMSPNVLSANQAVQLLPFFLLGLTFLRHRDWMMQRRRILILLCLAAIAAGTIWNLSHLAAEGELSRSRRDLQSLAVGLGICLLSVLVMPRLAALSRIGTLSFTIYLYHVLGTASSREVLLAIGVASIPVHFVLGIAGGLLFPMVLHLLASQSETLRGPVLGLWRPHAFAQRPATERAQS